MVIYLILVIPVGRYLYHIAAGKHTFADPVFDRIDGLIYKAGGVDPHRGMNWRQYALALLGANAVMIAIGYLILRIQSIGIFNPNHIGGMEPSLAFNTIISFMTNTNLQHYSCLLYTSRPKSSQHHRSKECGSRRKSRVSFRAVRRTNKQFYKMTDRMRRNILWIQ